MSAGAVKRAATRVFVPRDSGALSLGAEQVAVALKLALAERIERGAVQIVRNGSRGLYWLEPLVEVETAAGRFAYGPVAAADVAGLLDSGLLDARQAHTLALGRTEDIPFLRQQQRLTFARAGVIDPLDLDDYRASGGYRGLERALDMSAQALVDEIKPYPNDRNADNPEMYLAIIKPGTYLDFGNYVPFKDGKTYFELQKNGPKGH